RVTLANRPSRKATKRSGATASPSGTRSRPAPPAAPEAGLHREADVAVEPVQRYGGGETRRLHTRNGGEPLVEGVRERANRFASGYRLAGRADLCRHHPRRVEAQVRRAQVLEAAHQQARAHEEHHRPMPASTRLSVGTCRRMRPLPGPIAERTASS